MLYCTAGVSVSPSATWAPGLVAGNGCVSKETSNDVMPTDIRPLLNDLASDQSLEKSDETGETSVVSFDELGGRWRQFFIGLAMIMDINPLLHELFQLLRY